MSIDCISAWQGFQKRFVRLCFSPPRFVSGRGSRWGTGCAVMITVPITNSAKPLTPSPSPLEGARGAKL